MDRRLLAYYNRELQHLRETGAEFAREFPKVAGRLALEEFTCADPYVERLLEGFSYLAARVHLKLDAEFPRFTQGLLETVYPHYLAPTPSMAVVQFQGARDDTSLAEGRVIPRGTAIQTIAGRGDTAPCEFRTAHEISLWPIEITGARYYARDLAALALPSACAGAKAAIRLQLTATAGLTFDRIKLDTLPLYIRATGELQMRLYEHIFRHAIGVAVVPSTRPAKWCELAGPGSVRQLGFEADQALLPFDARSFQGYRLLHEYFAFPQRFLFAELAGLARGLRRCDQRTVDVVILLREADLSMENVIDESNFVPFCSPVANLFPKRADRIHVSDRFHEFHVVPDRTRPRDFEVYHIVGVTGYGVRPEEEQVFSSFYSAKDADRRNRAYYTAQRLPQMTTEREQRAGARARYDGSEVFISLVDGSAAPYAAEVRQLGVDTLCTNRDLPLVLAASGDAASEFTVPSGAPVEAVRSVSGVPTSPRPAHSEGEYSWRLISHLTLNYLSLADAGDDRAAASLRDLLELYSDVGEAHIRKQIDGIRSVNTRPIVQRLRAGGPIAFARGLEVLLRFDEAAFEGGAFLLGAVLERFFAKYVSMNSFTKTIVQSVDRGEIMSWPARFGERQIL